MTCRHCRGEKVGKLQDRGELDGLVSREVILARVDDESARFRLCCLCVS